MAPPDSSSARHLPTRIEVLERQPERDPSSRGSPRMAGSADDATIRSRIERTFVAKLGGLSGGTPGGGDGGGVPSRFSRIHLPRTTGDVRSGYDVTVRMLPWPSRPPRRLSGGECHAAEAGALDVGDAVVPASRSLRNV